MNLMIPGFVLSLQGEGARKEPKPRGGSIYAYKNLSNKIFNLTMPSKMGE
jgi:hypothetical protein